MTAARLIGGRYEIGELLGYGGMAEVHKGKDVRLGRDIAVKVLRADLARDPAFQNRFRREAQAAAGLNHPSIVAVYDTGEDDGPEGHTPYIVMEYVEGHTLREVLKTQGHLPPQQAMEITAEVCSALDFSHRSGIVHRDIKPGNVMITNAGAIKVMDFGIARALADNAATVTATAAVIGTAQYLSPEQARGESVDARSDVYSTGCLLYELLTGHPPFTGDSPVAIAYQHVRENPQVPSSVNHAVPPALDSIVMKALAKNPLNRYQTAAEMRTDLQRALSGQAVEAEAVMTDAQRTQFIAQARPVARPGVLTPNYDDDDDTANHRGALIWTAVVLALLLVIGSAALYVLKRDNNADTPALYPVPALVGLSPAAAIDQLRSNHLIPATGKPEGSNGPCSAGSDALPLKNPTKGQVCTQNPAAGKEVADGTTVSFTVYTGPANVLVQHVVGLSYSEAQKALASEGLAASRSDIDSAKPAGQVVGQDPPANASVQPGTTVKLQVANGKVKLPDVTKLTEQQARTKLNQLGFTTIARSSTAPVQPGYQVGQVMAVDPTPGIFYDPSTTITLTVAVKPVCPSPSPSPSPSDTPSSSPSGSGSGTPSVSPSKSSTAASSSSAPSSNPSCTPG
ncbi:Stk1 family PASTA domain-containing Ser/Thr kinase [Jatrophihabitans sp.]|jgi:serine/threonine-protein kinase|uniref:Stk1 family PASTA domain-containing Ser/Thr kinase n=1 Tax=Jatrophihabitans sp. TaxID=1932789 RepID=UPI002EF27381